MEPPAEQTPTYRNPVLAADWPDPDAIRVGEDYYLVTSSFNRSPGLPVLHSRDLVKWDLLTHALPRVGPGFGLPRHGGGVWAPAIRHHAGTFHVVFPDPDRGLFVVSATDPAGPWSEPRELLAGLGLIDPCPFWDDDGSTWLVHGWARSRSGTKNRLSLVPVDAALTRPLGPGRTLIDGDEVPGCTTLEGPKLHRRGDDYLVFAPAGGVATGWQSVFRASSLTGPWEHRVVLHQGDGPVNGPHQGAWVDTPSGTDWFLHFQDTGAVGRVVHLQPLRWGTDGFPVIGRAAEGETRGVPVLTHPSPHGTEQGSRLPGGSDDFRTGIGPQWRWQADVPADQARSDDGELVLRGTACDTGNLRTLPQVLGQPVPLLACRFTTSVSLAGPAGARAGVAVLGLAYSWAGLRRTAHGDDEVVSARRAPDDQDERVEVHGRVPAGTRLHVELAVGADATTTTTLSWPGREPFAVLEGEPVSVGHWIGAETALFAAAPLGAEPGTARFGAFDRHLAPEDS
ncbi:glycoside hydrolase family 43 protein [Kineococcus rhizosphaerae]|uniref:Glycosyl hydrolase family 43 n=1 Tax=Kineococcus rhizosphaerae TaxID=559628 RepID=A0A2T0QXK0_9ACTN|nr:glycoside hydrolase 43 family protein [Kineococcus rhizosphaerae]PRY10547.1 glycosyl hydrolase family 43 [Kineococcus rhizosphaerae]